MNAYVLEIARKAGVPNPSPACYRAFEQMWLSGIAQGRKDHRDRHGRIRLLVEDGGFRAGYFNLFRPEPFASFDEVVAYWSVEAAKAKRNSRRDIGQLRMCKERLVYARYFRRYAKLIFRANEMRWMFGRDFFQSEVEAA